MRKPQRVVTLLPQTPRRFKGGHAVLNIRLPRELTHPEEFKDVVLVPAGERCVVPTGLAPFSEVLKSWLGLRLLLNVVKGACKPQLS